MLTALSHFSSHLSRKSPLFCSLCWEPFSQLFRDRPSGSSRERLVPGATMGP